MFAALLWPFAFSMASPAFPKFVFGTGLAAPPPEPLAFLGAPSGSEALAGGPLPAGPPLTIESIRLEAKIPEDLTQALLGHLKADLTTLPEHLSCIPDEDFGEAAEKMKLGEEQLSGLQKGQVLYFVKVLRQSVDRAAEKPVQAPTFMAAHPPPDLLSGDKRKISEVLDQIDEGPYPQLAPEKVAQMRQFHRDVTGGDPPDHERPTAEQLSALSHRLNSGKAPFADFAVFGPYGRRQTKLLRFTAQVFVHGELVTRQLRGPGSYTGWRASWNVFRAAMIMVNGASPAILDRYARGIEELVTLFPHAWGIISLADETMRSERWDILKESPGAAVSWEEVLADSSFGFDNRCAHWWFMHVLGPLTCGSRGSAASTIATIEGFGPGGHASAQGTQPASGGTPAAHKAKRGGNGGRFSGGNSKPTCPQFNTGECYHKNCSLSHSCSGCGGKFPLNKCWTCNPTLKSSKGGGPSNPSGGNTKHKKRKGGKGASGAPSTK